MNYQAGVCNLCGTGCGHFLHTDGNVIKGVTPSQNHPVSSGRLCVRGWHIHELMHAAGRTQTPMIREGGALRPAGYDEALALIARKMASLEYKDRQCGIIASARSSNEDNYLLMRLARTVLGTGNISVSAQSGHHASLTSLNAAFGVAGAIGTLADIESAAYILVVGCDITKLNPIIGSNIHLAAGRGARVVTLSSVRTQIAELSHRHLQQRPGTKRMALNACAKALLAIRENQPAFADVKALPGFGAYAGMLAGLAGDEAAAQSGIAYALIEEEMRLLAAAPSVVILFSSGISGLPQDTINALTGLALLSGKMGKKGSAFIPVAGICNLQGSFDMGLVPDRTVGFKGLEDKSTLAALNGAWRENVQPASGRSVFDLLGDARHELKVLFVVDHDDGVIRHKDKLSGIDLLVYIGAFQHRLMEMAHVVLPVAAFHEYAGSYTSTDRRVQLAAIERKPSTGVPAPWALFASMARGAGKAWPYLSSADVFAEIAEVVPGYAGLSHAALSRNFGCYAGASQPVKPAAFPSACALPKMAAPDAEFPFSLMIGKAQHYWHQHNLMRKTFIPRREFDATLLLYPQGYIEIHPDDAKRLGVKDKWLVRVSSRGGAMNIAVKVSPTVLAGSAYIPYFIKNMIGEFLVKHDELAFQGEESVMPIKIERV